MIVLNDISSIGLVDDPNLRGFVERRFQELGEGQMIVVEPGDSVEVLEQESGCPILRDLFDEARFGDEDFAPAFEVLEDHGVFWEMAFIFSDDGCGVELFIPKHEGIDPELLSMCVQYAVPV